MKIICVGRNYAKHIDELGNERTTEPVIFQKPNSAILRQRDAFYIPSFTNDVHYELELIILINRLGKNIQARFAHKYYQQISVGIDFTARDVQKRLKEKGLPWEKAKAFDQSAAIGKWVNKKKYEESSWNIKLLKNTKQVQQGQISDMLFSINEIIEHVSSYFTLKIGDIIFTGTPEGVGPVLAGDKLEGFLNDEKLLDVDIK